MSPLAPGTVALVARHELLRTVRSSVSWSLRSAILLILLPLVLLVYSAGIGFVAYLVGPDLASGDVPVTFVRWTMVAVFAMVAFFTGQRALKRTGRIDHSAGVLTAVRSREVFVALVVAEYVRSLAFVLLPSLAGAVGLAAGTGSAAVAVSVVLAVLGTTFAGVALGFVLGLAGLNLVARSAFVASHRTAIGLTATAVLLGGYVVGFASPALLRVAYGVADAVPIGWVGDLALAPLGAGDPRLAAAAAVGGVVAAPALLSLGATLARWLWFADPVQPKERDLGGETGRLDRLDAVLGARLARPTVQVVRKSWRRAARAPFTVQYAVVPFFGLVTPFQQVVRTGQVPGYLPAMLALSGAWATGAAFTLNPIGGEGAVLPVVLAADVDARRFLGGLALAGVGLGVPVTVGLVLVGGVFSTAPNWLLAAWVGLGGLCCLVAPGLAAAAGVTFPKFDSTRIGGNREAIIPSVWAFLAYSIAFGVVVVPSLVAASPFVLGILADLSGVGRWLLAGAALGTTALLAVAAGIGGFRLAIWRFEDYSLD